MYLYLIIACETAGQKFGDDSLTSVMNAENAEIDDLSVVRDGDHLFLVSRQNEDTALTS